jgi:ribosomal protein L24E
VDSKGWKEQLTEAIKRGHDSKIFNAFSDYKYSLLREDDVTMLQDACSMGYETADDYSYIREITVGPNDTLDCCGRTSRGGETVLECRNADGKWITMHRGRCPKGDGILEGEIVRLLRATADNGQTSFEDITIEYDGLFFGNGTVSCSHCGEILQDREKALGVCVPGIIRAQWIHRHSCPVIERAEAEVDFSEKKWVESFRESAARGDVMLADYHIQGRKYVEGPTKCEHCGKKFDPGDEMIVLTGPKAVFLHREKCPAASTFFNAASLYGGVPKDVQKQIAEKMMDDVTSRTPIGWEKLMLPFVSEEKAKQLREAASGCEAFYSNKAQLCACCGKMIPVGEALLMIKEKGQDSYFLHRTDCEKVGDPVETCPECFGTGFVNGIGMPCSKGCKERGKR